MIIQSLLIRLRHHPLTIPAAATEAAAMTIQAVTVIGAAAVLTAVAVVAIQDIRAVALQVIGSF